MPLSESLAEALSKNFHIAYSEHNEYEEGGVWKPFSEIQNASAVTGVRAREPVKKLGDFGN